MCFEIKNTLKLLYFTLKCFSISLSRIAYFHLFYAIYVKYDFIIIQLFSASSFTVSTGVSLTVSTTSCVSTVLVSTAGASSGAVVSSATGSSTKSSFTVISLFSILAPTNSLVLAAFPTLSLK